jgi:phenylacetate-CoA ligase
MSHAAHPPSADDSMRLPLGQRLTVPAKLARGVIYPLQERLFRRPTFSYLAELERSQWLSRSDIEDLQLSKLRALLAIAHAHSPWHRRRLDAAGLQPQQLSGLQDLQRLPCMSKSDAAAHREELV